MSNHGTDSQLESLLSAVEEYQYLDTKLDIESAKNITQQVI